MFLSQAGPRITPPLGGGEGGSQCIHTEIINIAEILRLGQTGYMNGYINRYVDGWMEEMRDKTAR